MTKFVVYIIEAVCNSSEDLPAGWKMTKKSQEDTGLGRYYGYKVVPAHTGGTFHQRREHLGFFVFLLALPHGMWDLSSPTR